MTSDDDIASLFSAEASKEASAPSLDLAAQIVEEQAKLESEIMIMEAALALKQKELNRVKTTLVPDALKKANTASFTIADGPYAGVICTIADFVSGSLPKEEDGEAKPTRRDKAIKWLEENDGASLIKDTITIGFTKSQHNQALALVDDLKKQGHEAVFKSDVHPQSLMAYGRERLREGEELDAEALGLFVGTASKLIWPKAPRARKMK
jgi:hypothetical protein